MEDMIKLYKYSVIVTNQNKHNSNTFTVISLSPVDNKESLKQSGLFAYRARYEQDDTPDDELEFQIIEHI